MRDYTMYPVVQAYFEKMEAARKRTRNRTIATAGISLLVGLGIGYHEPILNGVRDLGARLSGIHIESTVEYRSNGNVVFGGTEYRIVRRNDGDTLWDVTEKVNKDPDEDLRVLAEILNKGNNGPWKIPVRVKKEKITRI